MKYGEDFQDLDEILALNHWLIKNLWLIIKISILYIKVKEILEESFRESRLNPQTIDWALAAILGHKSAHSFAIGPVAADPFISPLFVTITPALSTIWN